MLTVRDVQGKEGDFLCSCTAFDPYILHGNGYKGPKPLVVVLKSRKCCCISSSQPLVSPECLCSNRRTRYIV